MNLWKLSLRITSPKNSALVFNGQISEAAKDAIVQALDDQFEDVARQRDAFKDAAEYNQRRAESAEQQRDELLAALEKFIDSHEECVDFDGFTAQIVSMDDYHEAQEAISSVKGGAA